MVIWLMFWSGGVILKYFATIKMFDKIAVIQMCTTCLFWGIYQYPHHSQTTFLVLMSYLSLKDI